MIPGTLFYLSTACLPSSTANALQVMKMCQAFHQENYGIRLVAPVLGPETISPDHIRKQYGLSTMFPITTIPAPQAGRGIRYDVQAVMMARGCSATIIYTRSLRIAALATLFGHRVVVEVHDVPGGRWGPRYMRFILSNRKTAAVVVITEALRKEVATRFGDPRVCRVFVAPDGVDLERFSNRLDPPEVRRTLGLDPNSFTAGYAGSLYPGRGGEFIIDLAGRIPEGQFLVIGGPSERADELAAEASARGIDNILFRRAVANSELPLYLAACDVLLMPYEKGKISASGGGDISRVMSPLKMFEYLATGRLVMSSDLPVLREVLNDENAILCPPADGDAWEGALRAVANDSALRNRLGQRAREDARRYDWRARVKRIMEAVEI